MKDYQSDWQQNGLPREAGCSLSLEVFRQKFGENRASQVAQWLSLPVNARRQEETQAGLDPWVRKVPWRRKWQPTPVFLLGNPMDRGAWRDTVHGVAESLTQLSTLQSLVETWTRAMRQSFQGSQGRAYLFNSVVNVGCGPAEERVLLTGLHAVADIYCENCKTTLGWKYEHAFESSQKYKEGKYIIELAHMIKDNGWD
ncbi:protein yippee-like 2 isoform X1 [Muntiacus reevesi]|uniref:protein yippee-like 2 isoform X1 n=1 Tax=Muntiacus reevesi TaxID=9886 RepID=UPI003307692A